VLHFIVLLLKLMSSDSSHPGKQNTHAFLSHVRMQIVFHLIQEYGPVNLKPFHTPVTSHLCRQSQGKRLKRWH